jgi:hypothetical protein
MESGLGWERGGCVCDRQEGTVVEECALCESGDRGSCGAEYEIWGGSVRHDAITTPLAPRGTLPGTKSRHRELLRER